MQTIFSNGNIDIWNHYINTKLPESMDTIIRIIIPTVEASLLDLLGDRESFERVSGSIDFLENKDGTPRGILGLLEYQVNIFKAPNIPEDAVSQDEALINSYVTRISGVNFKPTEIDVETGRVSIGFSFEIGGMKND